MSDSYRNPFSGIDAAKLDPEQILEYWCNPFLYDLFSSVKEEDIYKDENNIVFMGGRSSGKSMFLRYWSYPVQKIVSERRNIKLLEVLEENEGVGIYHRIDLPRLNAFQGYGLSPEHWNSTFAHFFELLVGRQYIELLKLLEIEKSIPNTLISDVVLPKLTELLSIETVTTLEDILLEFDNRIREVEAFLGNVPFYKKEFVPKSRGFLSGTLSFGIPRIFISKIGAFKDLNMVILLDEYENYLDYQQRLINPLLRFSERQIKFRIGMRLEGFRTFKITSAEADDFIKEGREYRRVVFEEILNKDLGYHNFLSDITRKRLELIPLLKEKGFTDIKTILSESEDLETEALDLTANDHNKTFLFFSKKYPKLNFESVRYPNNPLLELLNFIWLTRGISVEKTLKSMNDYLENKKTDDEKKYRRDYVDKYKLSLTFLLCSIYKKNKLYYSFNTFAFLSSGIVGHFIELCRRSFAMADWGDNENLLNDGIIKKEFQTKAAIDFSTSEKQQIVRIETYGGIISRFIENIGNIFRNFHVDFQMRYPETNQFAINIEAIQNKELQNALRAAIKWTIIQKKPKMQITGPSERNLQDIYTINRILSPIFQLSYRTRGGKSIPLDQALLKELMYEEKIDLSKYLKLGGSQLNENNSNSQDLFSSL